MRVQAFFNKEVQSETDKHTTIMAIRQTINQTKRQTITRIEKNFAKLYNNIVLKEDATFKVKPE